METPETTVDPHGTMRPQDHGSPRARRRKAACPLTLWRTRDPARISPAEVLRLAKLLAAIEILHERRWKAARTGDAAAAAAVAMDHLHGRASRTRLTDVILGNLVVLAFGGDATAGVIIAHALETFGRLDPTDPALTQLARRWGAAPAFHAATHASGSSRPRVD
jgi:ABC-type protease/lipase transport system fused ATPase/permease subunit